MATPRIIDQADESQAELARAFQDLAEQWRSETAIMSSASRMASHPAYQAIIALGRPVVPLILREMEREPDHWFRALTAITGEDPILPEDTGNVRRMTDAWLAYGREHGYI